MPTVAKKTVRLMVYDLGARVNLPLNKIVYQSEVVEGAQGKYTPDVSQHRAKDIPSDEGVWLSRSAALEEAKRWKFGKKNPRKPLKPRVRVKQMKKNHQASWIDLGDGTKYHYKPLPGGKGYEVHVPAGNGDKKIGVVSKMPNGKWHAKGKGKKLGGFESFKIATLYLLGKYKPTMQKNPTVSPSLVLTAIGRELKARKYPGVKVVKPSSKHGQITAQLVFGAWKNGRKSEKLIVRVINFMDADRTIIDGLGTGATVKTAKSIPAEAKSYVDRIEQLGYAPKKPTAVKAAKGESTRRNPGHNYLSADSVYPGLRVQVTGRTARALEQNDIVGAHGTVLDPPITRTNRFVRVSLDGMRAPANNAWLVHAESLELEARRNPARKTLKRKAGSMKKNPGADIAFWRLYLSHKLTRYDMQQSAREAKRGSVNIYRLGHLMGAAQKVDTAVKGLEGRDDAEALKKFEAALDRHFTSDFAPVKAVKRDIAKYLKTGVRPKIGAKNPAMLPKKCKAVKNPSTPKAPTKKQINTLAAEFKRLRAAASKKVPELMRTKLVLDSSVHDSARHFAMTRKLADGSWTIHAAPELAAEPKHIRIGVLRHEFGHSVLHDKGKVPKGNDALERATDREAEKLFGAKIYYDKRGVETTSSTGKRPRPAGLY